MDGFGKNVPPTKKDVIVYFVQKGFSEKDALDFFNFYNGKKWVGKGNKPVLNWKRIAWNWIMRVHLFYLIIVAQGFYFS